MSSFPFTNLKSDQYIVWSNDVQHNRQVLQLRDADGTWTSLQHALYDKTTGMVTPLAELDDATFRTLPNVLASFSFQTIDHYKQQGWKRGASITVPWDDPRRSVPGANDLNNRDLVPRWEEGTGPSIETRKEPPVEPSREQWLADTIAATQALLARLQSLQGKL